MIDQKSRAAIVARLRAFHWKWRLDSQHSVEDWPYSGWQIVLYERLSDDALSKTLQQTVYLQKLSKKTSRWVLSIFEWAQKLRMVAETCQRYITRFLFWIQYWHFEDIFYRMF